MIFSSDWRNKRLQYYRWWKIFFDQPFKVIQTYHIIQKIVTGEGDDNTTGCLLGYNYFKDYHKIKAIDLSKQKPLDADPKSIHQINFTGNVAWGSIANTIMLFIIEEAKETVLYCSQVTVKVF